MKNENGTMWMKMKREKKYNEIICFLCILKERKKELIRNLWWRQEAILGMENEWCENEEEFFINHLSLHFWIKLSESEDEEDFN